MCIHIIIVHFQVADDPKSFPKVTEQILIELKDEAKKCHDAEVANYNISIKQ